MKTELRRCFSLLVMLCDEFDMADIKTLWLSHIKIVGTHFTSESSIFSAIWLDGLQRCFYAVLCLCFAVKRARHIPDYKVCLLMGFD